MPEPAASDSSAFASSPSWLLPWLAAALPLPCRLLLEQLEPTDHSGVDALQPTTHISTDSNEIRCAQLRLLQWCRDQQCSHKAQTRTEHRSGQLTTDASPGSTLSSCFHLSYGSMRCSFRYVSPEMNWLSRQACGLPRAEGTVSGRPTSNRTASVAFTQCWPADCTLSSTAEVKNARASSASKPVTQHCMGTTCVSEYGAKCDMQRGEIDM